MQRAGIRRIFATFVRCRAQNRALHTDKSMKKILSTLLLAWLLCGCAETADSDSDTLYVSILPLREIVQEITGDDFRVEVLVPAGASPETFEPTARQFVALNRATMIFSVGLLDFERSLLEKVEHQERVITLSHGIELIAGSCSHHHAAEHAEGTACAGHHHPTHGIDPHIWTSPRSLRRMAENCYEAIRAAWPDSVKYAANYERLCTDLQELDSHIAAKVEAADVDWFLIYHPALTYYARDYGLHQVAIEEEGKEPSARRIAELIRQARVDGVRRVFYQSQFPASSVAVIASDIGGEAIAIDPLAADNRANIDRITDLITAK